MYLYALIHFIKQLSWLTSHNSLAFPKFDLSRGLISQKHWKHLRRTAGPSNGSHSVAQVALVELIGHDSDMPLSLKKREMYCIFLLIHSLKALSTHFHCSSMQLSSLSPSLPPAPFSLWSFIFIVTPQVFFCLVKAHCQAGSQTAHGTHLNIVVWVFLTHSIGEQKHGAFWIHDAVIPQRGPNYLCSSCLS